MKVNEQLMSFVLCLSKSHVEPQSKKSSIIIANELTEGSMYLYKLDGEALLTVFFF